MKNVFRWSLIANLSSHQDWSNLTINPATKYILPFGLKTNVMFASGRESNRRGSVSHDARSFDIDTSFPKLYDLVSNDTTPNIVMARTNAASPVVVSYVSTSVTKEGCGKAHIGEGVNKPNDRVDSSSASTNNMGLANVEKCVLLLVRMVVPQRMEVNRLFSSTKGVDSMLRDAPWMIHEVPIFLNKWSPYVSLLKEDLSCVPVWVKFHDVSLVAYTSDSLSLIATKICNPMMLDSYTNSMCLESWRRSIYSTILIEIDTCNDFSDNLVMVVPNFKGNGYTKETIRVEYEWKPPHYCTCLIFSHILNNFPKAPKRVVNKMDKGKGGSSGADSEAKQLTEAASQKTTPSVGKKNVSISGDGTFSFINSVRL
ncbi:zinc knuckle CX2CX4HX4C containing protein [Tanacetum coccineum]